MPLSRNSVWAVFEERDNYRPILIALFKNKEDAEKEAEDYRERYHDPVSVRELEVK